MVVPFLSNNSKAHGLVNIPVQRATLALPDPKLLVVVILATIGQLFGLDEDVVEEVGADWKRMSVSLKQVLGFSNMEYGL